MPAPNDKASGEVSLQSAWRPLTRRVAVAAGCFAALVSLLNHVPVSVASLRGAAAFAAVLLIAKVGLAALSASLAADERAGGEDGGEDAVPMKNHSTSHGPATAGPSDRRGAA